MFGAFLHIYVRGPKKPPKIPKYQKQTAFTGTFSRSSRELLPSSLCDASQEPNGNCSEKLVQMNIIFFWGGVDFFWWISLLWYVCFLLLIPCRPGVLSCAAGGSCCPAWCTKIAQSQSLAISALTAQNRQKSRRKKGFWAQKSQPEIANR